MLYLSIGTRLRQLRNERGLTIEKVARDIGLSFGAVSMYERGERVPPIDKLKILANYYGVKTADLLDDDDPTPTGRAGVHYRVNKADMPLDKNGRVLRCPECGREPYAEDARYCTGCGFPLSNLCISEERHPNPPDAEYCAMCGAPTFWSLTPVERRALRIPADLRNRRKSGDGGARPRGDDTGHRRKRT